MTWLDLRCFENGFWFCENRPVCSWCSWPTCSSWCGSEWRPSLACLSSCTSTYGPCVRTPAWWREPTSALTCVSLVCYLIALLKFSQAIFFLFVSGIDLWKWPVFSKLFDKTVRVTREETKTFSCSERKHTESSHLVHESLWRFTKMPNWHAWWKNQRECRKNAKFSVESVEWRCQCDKSPAPTRTNRTCVWCQSVLQCETYWQSDDCRHLREK